MGHIDLASPVSHIWYARGIPSRIGLLLDLSTRNLERVILFFHYIVISVDEAARDEVLKRLDEETREEIIAKTEEYNARIAEAEENDAEPGDINRMRSELGEEKAQIEEKYLSLTNRVKELAPRMLLPIHNTRKCFRFVVKSLKQAWGRKQYLKSSKSSILTGFAMN
jgi:DNA-directed RNA polymerase subunit beta'